VDLGFTVNAQLIPIPEPGAALPLVAGVLALCRPSRRRR
jgi:hypothetical protein